LTSEPALYPLLWNWYYGFVFQFGHTLAVAIPFSLGVMLHCWLYQRARAIATGPVPHPWSAQFFKGFWFVLLLLGSASILVGCIFSFYLLSGIVFKLLPQAVEMPPGVEPPVSALFFSDEARGSVFAYLTFLSLGLSLVIFALLCRRGRSLAAAGPPQGLGQRFVQEYFHDHLFFGLLLGVIWWFVLFMFLYHLSSLVMLLRPELSQMVLRHPLPQAARFHFLFLWWLWAILVAILLAPIVLLLLRAEQKIWRYRWYFWRHISEYPFLYLYYRLGFIFSLAGAGMFLMFLFAMGFFKLLLGIPLGF